MDAFNVAFRVPNLLRDLFAEGAMTAAFVPTFTRTLTTQGRESAWRLGNLVINALLVVTGVAGRPRDLFAGPITHAMASGKSSPDVPGKLELTTQLTRMMLPFLTTVAVAVAMMGMLNSLHRFFIPALSPAMFNVATIACALAARAGDAIASACRRSPPSRSATVIGGLGQIALQWPILHREGFRYRPVARFQDPGAAPDSAPDGSGHARARGGADQRVREHLPRDDAAAGRGVVAELRVPVDVPADRTVRRLDRDGGAARHRAPRGSERQGRDSQRRCRKASG